MIDSQDYQTQEYIPQLFSNKVLFNNISVPVPDGVHPGAFAAVRKHDIHTGVDLYVPEGTAVYALYDGVVVDVSKFTGPEANPPCPWWNETYSVTVFHKEIGIFLLYGEICPAIDSSEPFLIKKGHLLGNVCKVLKKDKGLPMSMLHVEAYTKLKTKIINDNTVSVIHPYWHHNDSCPDGLIDPTPYII